MATAKTAERVVQHATVKWVDKDGQVHRAFRRQKIKTNLIPKAQLERLDSLGAFAPENTEPEELPTVGELATFEPEMSDAELQAWVRAADTDTIVTAAADYPGEAERLLIAESYVADADDRDPRPIEQGIAAALNQG